MQLFLVQVATHHDRVGSGVVQECRKVRDVAQCLTRRGFDRVDEADGVVLSAGGERVALESLPTGDRGADEQRARHLALWTPKPPQQAIRNESLDQEAKPDRRRRHGELEQGEIDTPRPQRSPHRHRGGERRRDEQAAWVPSPIIGRVAAGDDERDDEGDTELPAVEDATGEHNL